MDPEMGLRVEAVWEALIVRQLFNQPSAGRPPAQGSRFLSSQTKGLVNVPCSRE